MRSSEFGELAGAAFESLRGDEFALLSLAQERSDFIRFNRARIRQAGRVTRADLTLRLIDGERQVFESFVSSGSLEQDQAVVRGLVGELRKQLRVAPADPYLLIERRPLRSHASSAESGSRSADAAGELARSVVEQAGAHDFVGFLADGTIARALRSSSGADHWFDTERGALEFSIYVDAARAVKRQVAAERLAPAQLGHELRAAAQIAQWLARPPVELKPGRYRTLFEPAAVEAIGSMFGWNGFSLRAYRTGQSPLARFHDGQAQFSPMLSLSEAPGRSGAPRFNSDGFVAPEQLPLINAGERAQMLVCARSQKEFGVPANGAAANEFPSSLVIEPGRLAQADQLRALDTGLWLGNLWYLNWSDRSGARVTGMSRFACFWVEHGEVVGPINRLRFDDSLYRVFGSELEALGDTQHLLPDFSTYDGRVLAQATVPSMLVRDFVVTL